MGTDEITLFMTSIPLLRTGKSGADFTEILKCANSVHQALYFFSAHAQEPGNEATSLCG